MMLANIEDINKLTQSAARQAKDSPEPPASVMGLIDLTSLNEQDDGQTITKLCAKAITPIGNVAAVCVLPQFVRLAKQELAGTAVKIATVANFPQGNDNLAQVLNQIKRAIADGADEVDVVAPYQSFLQDPASSTFAFLQACKQACQTAKLKVILETGALQKLELIAKLSQIAIEAGADFIKTSTGKITVGAQLDAAAAMLFTIKHSANQAVGFKASGGIKTLEQAAGYVKLAELILGQDWIKPERFRLGASSLVDCLLVSPA